MCCSIDVGFCLLWVPWFAWCASNMVTVDGSRCPEEWHDCTCPPCLLSFSLFLHFCWSFLSSLSRSSSSCCWEVLQMLTLQCSRPGVFASCGWDLQERCDLLLLTVSYGCCRYIQCTLLPRSIQIYHDQVQKGSLPCLPFWPEMCQCVLAVCSYSVALGEEKSWFAAIIILLASLLRSFYWLIIDSSGHEQRGDAPWPPSWWHSVLIALIPDTICPKLVSYEVNLSLGLAWSYLLSWKLLSGWNLDQNVLYMRQEYVSSLLFL